MELLTVKEVSKKWNISVRRVAVLCEQGRIEGASKIAGVWILPPDCKKPSDARIKSGKYVNWRNSTNITSSDFNENLKNLEGTFAVENLEISGETRSELQRLSTGEVTCAEIINELKQKYMQRV